MAQLVEALRYKLEGGGFHSRWCQWSFSLTWSFRPHYGPAVDTASNRNENQKYFLGIKRPVHRADNLTTSMCRLSRNLGASASWKPQGLSRPVMGLLPLLFGLFEGLRRVTIKMTVFSYVTPHVRTDRSMKVTASFSVTLVHFYQ